MLEIFIGIQNDFLINEKSIEINGIQPYICSCLLQNDPNHQYVLGIIKRNWQKFILQYDIRFYLKVISFKTFSKGSKYVFNFEKQKTNQIVNSLSCLSCDVNFYCMYVFVKSFNSYQCSINNCAWLYYRATCNMALHIVLSIPIK